MYATVACDLLNREWENIISKWSLIIIIRLKAVASVFAIKLLPIITVFWTKVKQVLVSEREFGKINRNGNVCFNSPRIRTGSDGFRCEGVKGAHRVRMVYRQNTPRIAVLPFPGHDSHRQIGCLLAARRKWREWTKALLKLFLLFPRCHKLCCMLPSVYRSIKQSPISKWNPWETILLPDACAPITFSDKLPPLRAPE